MLENGATPVETERRAAEFTAGEAADRLVQQHTTIRWPDQPATVPVEPCRYCGLTCRFTESGHPRPGSRARAEPAARTDAVAEAAPPAAIGSIVLEPAVWLLQRRLLLIGTL